MDPVWARELSFGCDGASTAGLRCRISKCPLENAGYQALCLRLRTGQDLTFSKGDGLSVCGSRKVK